MRNHKVAFLSCAAVVLVGLLAAPAAMATGYSCSSFKPSVTVALGPCPVSGPNPEVCEPPASVTGFTGIKYHVEGSPESIAALVTANNTVVSGGTKYDACVGDPATGLGKQSCHEKVVAFGCRTVTADFWVVVSGNKVGIPLSVAVRKDFCVKSFLVTGLGTDFNPFQQAQKFETVNFKGCAVKFEFDVVTGAVVSAALDPTQSTKRACAVGENNSECCAFTADNVSNLELKLNGQTLGTGQFGEGYVSSGTNSCTTRVIGGRVYSWGSPCPN